MVFSRSAFWSALALCGLACDDEGGGVRTVELPHGCKWGAFEASVLEGPDAPTTLRGYLVIAAVDDALTELGGMLVQANDDVVPVMGHLSAGRVELRFMLAAGTVVGQGSLARDGELCQEGLEGELHGPAEGDRGDWLAVGVVSYSDPSSTYTLEPSGASGDGGFTFNATEQVSGSCTKTTEREYSVLSCKSGGVTCKFFYDPSGVLFLDRCYDASGKPIKKPGES